MDDLLACEPSWPPFAGGLQRVGPATNPLAISSLALEIQSHLLPAEGEIDTGDVLEVVLTRGGASDVIGSEVGVQIVHFDGTELNTLGDWYVKAAAELHGETIIAPAARATSTL
jgi:hypothetical protein